MSIRWSILAVRLDDLAAAPWIEQSSDLVLKTASVGKLLVLGDVARRIDSGELAADLRVSKTGARFVRDSGLWHTLDQDELTLVDACRLVGAVSDNLATNVLLDLVGLDAVAAYGDSIGAKPMEMLDYVSGEARDRSVPGTPETLSRASAAALVHYLRQLYDGVVSARVEEWMSLSTDLSMVASAFLEDPLAHNTIDEVGHPFLINKTGTDDGIRADVGLVRDGDRAVGYAAVANWPTDDSPPGLSSVMARMGRIGAEIRDRMAEG
ncbi:serine hydrolase [Flexivirga endophytica]|uniref:Serine hydrolase n=1 Tax=Flexivirga endophytica TaxID=1849103 RepID=A0A916T4P5_9MICO|nr:serine hydrolase [Flexivirga endophytica]GGB28085.1 serine hydrolase [Flexivirga endophytica]GHB61939.1 serine hydrolase [Flexivirga endophytica]